ncbi:MAG: helix-turn-helix domain-containing protein [Acidobacteriota bacterium]
MTDEEVRRAAQSDPDARPRSVGELSQACTVPEDIDVRAIRLKRKMSQAAFAQVYGFALDALQDWEQGRRRPNRSARILLAVIDREPEAVERALSKRSRHLLAMLGLADRCFTAESLQQVAERVKKS